MIYNMVLDHSPQLLYKYRSGYTMQDLKETATLITPGEAGRGAMPKAWPIRQQTR